jgi:hypothetical protein
MVASPMLLRSVIAALLLLMPGGPAFAEYCTADVQVSESDGLKLDVRYLCHSDHALTFTADGDRMARRVGDFRAGNGDSPTPSNNVWTVEPVRGVVEARYRFDLTAYARSVDSTSSAVQRGDSVLVLLSGWLLEPRGFGINPKIDIRVRTAPGLRFAAGLRRTGDVWSLQGRTNVRFAGFTAFGKFHHEEIAVPAPGALRAGARHRLSTFDLAILDGFGEADRPALVEWVKRTVEAGTNYWEGSTTSHMMVALVPNAGRTGVSFGRSVPGGGASVMVEIGTRVDRAKLYNDWVLVHELIHTGMPYIRGRAQWFMEGAATYVEPIIRARAGWKTEQEVWDEWIGNMPQGTLAFSIGLQNSSGRQTYWAGAIFMLLADLELRRVTEGAEGLEDCLKGALWSGLEPARRVSLDEYVAACDKATGTKVMAGLVAKHFTKGEKIDLAKLWSDLGVAKGGAMNDKAPLAKWRKMIVYGDKPMKKVERD